MATNNNKEVIRLEKKYKNLLKDPNLWERKCSMGKR
tara:strand:- start:72 stop:179 length:108 start_codon:yes stop_codon:yes gene_type:complete